MNTFFEGVHAALVTPFDTNDDVDADALSQLADDLIARGVHGLVVNGSTGEFSALNSKERRLAVETVEDAIDGRVPLTVHVGALSTREAVQHAQHAGEHGAQCVLLVSPYYEEPSEQEIEAYVRAVANVGIPIMIYNNPAGTGWSMRPELIAQLAAIDAVKYLKDTTGDARRIYRIQELCGDSIEMLNGQDTLALLGFLAGARATVWGAANVTPEECILLWNLTVDSLDLDAANRLWDAFFPVNRFLEEAGYVAAVKAGARLRGRNVGDPRLPIMPLSNEAANELARLLDRLEETRERLVAPRENRLAHVTTQPEAAR